MPVLDEQTEQVDDASHATGYPCDEGLEIRRSQDLVEVTDQIGERPDEPCLAERQQRLRDLILQEAQLRRRGVQGTRELRTETTGQFIGETDQRVTGDLAVGGHLDQLLGGHTEARSHDL